MADFITNSVSGWRVSNPYRLIFETMVGLDDPSEIIEKQNTFLEANGFDLYTKAYEVRFGRKTETEDLTIDEAIQCLALKDGADLVQFENGNFGFVGYYHGFNENWFEIIGGAKNEY